MTRSTRSHRRKPVDMDMDMFLCKLEKNNPRTHEKTRRILKDSGCDSSRGAETRPEQS